MQLQLQDFPTLIRNQAAAVAASCRTLVDLSVGSVLRAILEANAAVALWMQWLILEVLSLTRAATSAGVDLDSWVADFGLSRLPAVAATGTARFSRATAGLQAVIPAGALIRTGVGADAQAFTVVADSSQASWDGSGFVMGTTVTELILPIEAVVAGRAGNVQAGVLTLLSTAIPGVDSVVNDYPASGGLDAESDAALRLRFSGFIDSRTRATAQAIGFAIQSVQQGLQFVIAERVDPSGAVSPGHFTVVVDDGTGDPSDALLGAVGAAVEAVRALGSTYSVIRPALVSVSVSMAVVGSAGSPATVQAAVGSFLSQLPIGAQVFLSKLTQVAHDSDPSVVRISGVTINGLAADLQVAAFSRPIAGVVTVTT
jgi:uncharacterized phage protein gp47/JayE